MQLYDLSNNWVNVHADLPVATDWIMLVTIN